MSVVSGQWQEAWDSLVQEALIAGLCVVAAVIWLLEEMFEGHERQ